jgi:hypothetical protein
MSQYETDVIKLLTQIADDLRWLSGVLKGAIVSKRKRTRSKGPIVDPRLNSGLASSDRVIFIGRGGL